MLSMKDNPVEWGIWLYELVDAHGHLGKLVGDFGNNDEVSEEDLRIQLGHIYSHLNRAWNTRNRVGEISEEEWAAFSEFPADIDWT